MKNAKPHVTLQKRAGNGYSPPSLCDMQLPRESLICLSFDGDKDNDDDDGEVDGSDIDDGSANGNGGGSNDAKNNDLIVIPMSRAPGSEDHNGDSMVVTMILKKNCDDETYEQDTKQ